VEVAAELIYSGHPGYGVGQNLSRTTPLHAAQVLFLVFLTGILPARCGIAGSDSGPASPTHARGRNH